MNHPYRPNCRCMSCAKERFRRTQQAIVQALDVHGDLSTEQLADRLKVSVSYAQSALTALQDAGRIRLDAGRWTAGRQNGELPWEWAWPQGKGPLHAERLAERYEAGELTGHADELAGLLAFQLLRARRQVAPQPADA